MCRRTAFLIVALMSGNTAATVSADSCTFAEHLDYVVGTGAYSIAIGDLDGDGDPDLAVANEISDDVSVLLNNGDGTFATHLDYYAATSPRNIALGDLDGDDDLDLAMAHYGQNFVTVMFNDGSGAFSPAVTYYPGNRPRTLAMGDLDADGDLDLAVACYTLDYVSVLRNNGNGTFAPAAPYGVGDGPWAVALADLDGDGDEVNPDLDIVVTNFLGDTVSVRLNNGNGTFATGGVYVVGDGPRSVAIGDLDDDLDPDLVVGNKSGDSVSVLLNNGNGTFTAHVPYSMTDPSWLDLGDLDNDGDLDLAVASAANQGVSMLTNYGSGAFGSPVDYAVAGTPFSVVVADLDDDGDVDAVADGSSTTISVLMNECIAGPNDCPADLDDNDTVGSADLALLLGDWGVNPDALADLNSDGVVNSADLALLLGDWGPCPQPPICGDGVVNQPNETCDPPDDGACPLQCLPNCTCPVSICGPGAGDCCVANGTPGCDNTDCCDCICTCDPFCCSENPGASWDTYCAGDGVDGSCGASNPIGPCADVCAACVP